MLRISFVLFTLSAIVLAASPANAQITLSSEQYRVFDAKGNAAGLDKIIDAAGNADVIFLGEQHDDAVAHAIQYEIFKRIVERYAAERRVALSMEMFERDVQIVVDEYLSGLISESHFLLNSRPWGNYKTDYRPLVELAKQKHLPVIAANAPRRYVNMVSRGGRDTLNALSPQAKAWLPKLPYGQPSAAYAAKFKALMGPSPEAQQGIDNILASQALWDAAMADSIARFLKKNKNALVVHLNGAFHTESRLGTVEQLLAEREKTRVIVVTMRYTDDVARFDKEKDTGTGDFVILTDTKVPRSKR